MALLCSADIVDLADSILTEETIFATREEVLVLLLEDGDPADPQEVGHRTLLEYDIVHECERVLENVVHEEALFAAKKGLVACTAAMVERKKRSSRAIPVEADIACADALMEEVLADNHRTVVREAVKIVARQYLDQRHFMRIVDAVLPPICQAIACEAVYEVTLTELGTEVITDAVDTLSGEIAATAAHAVSEEDFARIMETDKCIMDPLFSSVSMDVFVCEYLVTLLATQGDGIYLRQSINTVLEGSVAEVLGGRCLQLGERLNFLELVE
eukprot:GEMP01059216.1.p1 GENE.GEMP01059216.1~~GEMP01059216.1.p1  ORF type:complete len:272 (+),score=80.65 GEMP01059216.1:134-949(+)